MAFNSLYKSKVAEDSRRKKTSNGPTNIFGAMSLSRSSSADDDDNDDDDDDNDEDMEMDMMMMDHGGGPLPKISDHSTADLSDRSPTDSMDGDNSYDRGVREVCTVGRTKECISTSTS
jgi:hypothetical protein